MTALTTSLATGSAFAAPLKRCGVQVPTLSHSFQQSHDLLRRFWMLPVQTAFYQNALH